MKQQRILHLIKQAELGTAPDTLKQESGTEYLVSQEGLERFAELIIQECATQLDANRVAVFDANQHHEYWNCGVKWAVAKLKNHFSGKMKYVDCNTI